MDRNSPVRKRKFDMSGQFAFEGYLKEGLKIVF
jgi:hypothetical protein